MNEIKRKLISCDDDLSVNDKLFQARGYTDCNCIEINKRPQINTKQKRLPVETLLTFNWSKPLNSEHIGL